MNAKTILNVAGLSIALVGGFLLSIEAIRVARVAKLSSTLGEIARSIGGGGRPLPLTWRFALTCAIVCIVVWVWAPVLLIWTITPAGFVILFIFYKATTWAVSASADGFAAVVGFVLFSMGTALQLISALI
jgi:hypothetical protein